MTKLVLGETLCANCGRSIQADEEFSHAAGKFRHTHCPKDTVDDQLDKLFDKHTVALTKYTEEQTVNPDLPSLLEITDLDTRVINTHEIRPDLKALMLSILVESLGENDVAGMPILWTGSMKNKLFSEKEAMKFKKIGEAELRQSAIDKLKLRLQ